ncbi:MAG TPA: hypothetical protein DC049_18255 [Spirochaetia bacterium]|nr:hypothetical protein [Spirochaetia bacterium]
MWEYYRISRDEMNINTSRKDLTTRAFAENLSRHRALNKEAGELKERMQNQKKINQLLQEANTMFYRYDMKLTSEGSTDFDKEEIKKQSSQPFRYFSRRTDIFIELFGDYLEKKIPVNVVLPSKSSGVSQIEFASTVIAKLQKINLAGKYRQIGDLEFYSSVLKKAVLEKPFNIKPEDFRRMLCTTKEEKNHASEFFEYRSQIETVREMRNLIGIISNLIAEEIQNRKSNNPDLLSAQVSENKFQILFENKTATYGDLLRLGYALSLRIAYDLYHPAARAKYISDEDYEAEMNRIKNETEYLEPLAE